MKKENKKQWWLLLVSIVLIVFGVNYMDGHFDEKNFHDYFRISYLTLAWLIIPLVLSFFIDAYTNGKKSFLKVFISCNCLIILLFIGLFCFDFCWNFYINYKLRFVNNYSFFEDEGGFYSDEENKFVEK